MSAVRFGAVHVCLKCEVRLSNHDRMYSHGVCPYCGYSSDSNICDCTKRVVKLPEKKWYQFWRI